MKKILIFTLLLSFSFNIKAKITIASKSFTESIILSEMLALILEEKYQLEVERKMNLGGTSVVFNALQNENIDIYPDYTGTGYVFILKKKDKESNPNVIFQRVKAEFQKRYGISWSNPIGINNTYALAVRRNDKRFTDIKRVSDLSGKADGYIFGSPPEFMERQDGFNNLIKTYSLDFGEGSTVELNSGLMYSAIKDKKVDIIIVYSTDGRIKSHDLKLLKDDKNFFPPYQAAWLAKKETLQKHPKLKEAIDLFDNLISDDEMTDLNNEVDGLKRSPTNVSRNFLIKKGILKGNKEVFNDKEDTFFQFLEKRKSYLLGITKDHLILSFVSLFIALLISIPTGIALTRFPKISGPVFAVINTFQTIPSLALLGFLIPLVGIGKLPAIIALFLYSLLPIVRNTFSGIKAVDKNYIEASRGMGLTDFQILKKVELPLAMPIILTGVRTASVIVIGTATLAALVGAGGLGEPILRGVATVNNHLILLGAIPSALLAIIVDKLLGIGEKNLVSKGLRL